MTTPPPPPPPPSAGPVPPPPPERREPFAVTTYDHERSRWGLGDFLVAEVIFYAFSILVGLTFWLLTSASGNDTFTGPWLVLATVGAPLLQLIYVTWTANARGRGLAADMQLRWDRSDVGFGVLIAIVGIIAAGIIFSIMSAFGADAPTAAAIEAAEDATGGTLTVSLVIFAIMGATLIPVAEELVFRGLFWGALEKRGFSNIVSWVITTVIFAAVHLEPSRFFILLGIGGAIGFGRLWFGRIGPCIVAHVLVNAMGMVALLNETA